MADVHLFEPRDAVLWKEDRVRSRPVTGDKNWTGENAPPGTAISYWLDDDEDDVTLTISDVTSGETFREMDGTGLAGMNRVQWNLRGDVRGDGGGSGPVASPGVYRVELSVDGDDYRTTVTVLEDVWLGAR